MSLKRQIFRLINLFSMLLLISIPIRNCASQTKAGGQEETAKSLTEGVNLTDAEVKQLEEQLKSKPEDLPVRTKLLNYYFLQQLHSESARTARQKHILWLIQHHPEAMIAGLPQVSVSIVLDKDFYQKAKKLWLEQAQRHQGNAAVLGNVANFFTYSEKGLAEDFLRKAQVLEPDNPTWSERLAQLHMLEMRDKSGTLKKDAALKSLSELESALNKKTDETERFYLLGDLARTAFEAEEFDKADKYAKELLSTAPRYSQDWNYGNAIHQGNLVLGRLALRSGEIEKAKLYLLQAGKTPGSPQLNSFGPNMALAKELLEKGEKEAVLEYFGLCSKFWKTDEGQLKEWTSQVKQGLIPDFGANLNY